MNIQTTLAAKIVEMLGQLAQQEIPPGHSISATMENLQQLLPPEHKPSFNEDMRQCLEMTTSFSFSLADNAVATGILPHNANFIAQTIATSLIHYSPFGCPTRLKATLGENRFGWIEVFWAYSMAGQDVSVSPT